MSTNGKNRARGKKRVAFRTREEAMEALKRALEHDRKTTAKELKGSKRRD